VAVAVVDVQVGIGNALSATRRLQNAASALQVEFQKVQAAARNAGASAIQFGRNLEQNTRKLRDQATTVQGLVGAYAGFRTIKGAISAAVELESAEKRAELLTQRFTKLSGIQQVAAQSADKFRLSQTATLTALVDLGNRLGPQGATINEIKDVYEGFNTILAINKVSTQEAAAAQLQLNQALGSGRLAGDEFRSVNEATPQVIDEIAKIMKIARGEVKDFAAEGKVTAPILIQALRNIKEKGADVLEQSFDTAGGRLRAFQKAQVELAAAIGTQLLPAFTPLLTTVTNLIVKFAAAPTPVKGFTAAVVGITGALVILGPVISGTITLIKTIGVATLVAAGPWIALAAGITAATVALASYQTQSQKRTSAIGAAALTGDAKALKEARTELKNLETQINKTPGRPRSGGGQRSAAGQTVVNLENRAAVLRRQIQQGEAVASAAAMPDGLQTLPESDDDKKKKGKKPRESQVPELTRELALLQQQTQLQGLLAQAAIAKNEEDRIRLEGIGRETELLHQAYAIEQSSVPLAEKQIGIAKIAEQLKQSQIQTAQELAQYDLQQRETGVQRVQQLMDEQKILEARINGNEAEVILQQQLRDILKDTKGLNEGEVKAILERNQALKRQAEQAEQLKQIYADVGNSIKSGVVEAIQGAIDGTKTLQEVATNLLNNIANRLLDVAVNLALFGALSGTGTGGGLLGGLFRPRANGGSVMAGQGYLVGERGPELFMPGRSGGIAPTGSFGGAGNIVVNVDANGSNVQGDGSQANALGKAIGIAVQQELIKQKRPGGLLS
jgi:tape measure domain-containing protein